MSALFVPTSRTTRAFERLDELMERGWEEDYCLGLPMFGPARCGKTSAFKQWVRCRQEADPSFRAGYTEVPANPTIKGTAGQMLKDLGDPDPEHGSENDRTTRIEDAGQEYDVIRIDEVQRLIDERTGRVRGDVAGWMTSLLNKRFCPLVFVGERRIDTVFSGNPYLEGRMLVVSQGVV